MRDTISNRDHLTRREERRDTVITSQLTLGLDRQHRRARPGAVNDKGHPVPPGERDPVPPAAGEQRN
jgi:hypothetical protein